MIMVFQLEVLLSTVLDDLDSRYVLLLNFLCLQVVGSLNPGIEGKSFSIEAEIKPPAGTTAPCWLES